MDELELRSYDMGLTYVSFSSIAVNKYASQWRDQHMHGKAYDMLKLVLDHTSNYDLAFSIIHYWYDSRNDEENNSWEFLDHLRAGIILVHKYTGFSRVCSCKKFDLDD